MKLLSRDETVHFENIFQSQQHSEGKVGLKNRTTVSKEEVVLYCINTGSKVVDLFYFLPCKENVHFKHQASLGAPLFTFTLPFTLKISTFKRGV